MASKSTPKTGPDQGSAAHDGVLLIDKLTQTYDSGEDRIGIDAQSTDGKVLRLWLTRRLGDALFGHLSHRLSAVQTRKDPDFSRHMQVWEQQSAQAQLKQDEPVRWQSESVLLSAVDITPANGSVKLVFKTSLAGADRPVAALTLSDIHMRQWLGIMFRVYQIAAWPLSAWPEWLGEAQRPMASEAEVSASAGDKDD